MSQKSINLIIYTENEELYNAFGRAIEALARIAVFKFSENSIKDEKGIILLATSEDKMKDMFYEDIRSTYLNPVVVIGFKEKEVFEKEHPLFYDHPFNHAYLEIPFKLEDLIAQLNEMIPISSQDIRRAICGSDTGYKGCLLKLLSHDLLKERDGCIRILEMALAFVNRKELTIETEKTIGEIKKNDLNWPSFASEMGQKLMNIIKED